MITLEEYKNSIIAKYIEPIDSLPEKIQKRTDNLARMYKDDYLSNIISDTYSFIYDVLKVDTVSKGYCKIPLEEDKTEQISLNLCGGYSSDTIFKDMQDRLISYLIMRKVFGDTFYMNIRIDEEEFDDEMDEDLFGFYFHYSIYMQGIPDNLKEIKENLFGKSIELKYN